MATLDTIVIQVTDAAQGGAGERMLTQQMEVRDNEGVIITPGKVVNTAYADLPAPEKAAYDTLKAYLQTQLDA